MSSYSPAVGMLPAAPARTGRLVLPVFTAALFLSALLLFGVQPMFTKMVLPVLGGTPAVWSVAMVVFQALLLAGYLYAHGLTRFIGLRAAAAVHLTVLAGAFLAMPIAVAPGWGRPPASGEALWLIGLFAASVGLPFFALAGNGPLLQAWFARSGHGQAKDPYFLYAASNIGSFAALVAYPLVVEPFLPLQEQSRWWMAGFGGLAALIAACAVLVGARMVGEPAIALIAPAPTWRRRLAWVGLSFIPSGLLVSVTAHISTDIAAAPLLWVAPLALFLLTFVLTFRDQSVTERPFMRRLQVWGTALAVLNLTITWPLALGLTVHLGLFFLNALACHGALYRLRPPASRLTEFYLCLSLGGVLGGIFCGLLAPQLFSTVLEYPILLVAALFCQPGFLGGNGAAWRRDAGRASLACAVALLGAGALTVTVLPADQVWWLVTVALVVMMMLLWRTPRFVAPLAVAGVLTAAVLWAGGPDRESVRSFFGVHKVARTSDGRFRTLSHGTTLHGAIRLLNEDGTPATGRPEPTTYFSFDGTIGSAIASVRQGHGGVLASVSVIGLGSGSLACHARPGEAWTFLEIDAEVLRIAMNPRFFGFLKECAPDAAVVIGDARLTLADRPAGMSLLVVDAFSSDAIPSHLITREALALYASKLEPNGVIVVHISNRHLDLARIVARTAGEAGFVAYLGSNTVDEPLAKNFRAASRVVALARNPSHLGPLTMTGAGAWPRLEPDMTRRPWTDDYSNIIQAILDKNRF